MPSINDVLRYAKPQIWKFIHQLAADLPKEQKEEIEQTANLRLVEAYSGLDPSAGWKSFVYFHCRGAVLDYMRLGKGFQEDRWTLAKPEEHDSRHVGKIRERISNESHDQEDLDLDYVLGANGAFSEMDLDRLKIRWDLLACMASIDDELHCFILWIRGYSFDDLGPIMGLQHSRIGQLIQSFISRFDDPQWNESDWQCQIIWAMGLAPRLGLPDCDQSLLFGHTIGWTLTPIQLDNVDHEPIQEGEQLDLWT
jgi:RNA polymerase sigma factor (sigma-70 family)